MISTQHTEDYFVVRCDQMRAVPQPFFLHSLVSNVIKFSYLFVPRYSFSVHCVRNYKLQLNLRQNHSRMTRLIQSNRIQSQSPGTFG